MMKIEKLIDAKGDTSAPDATITTNLLGPIRLTAALLPHLLKQKKASIINVTSGLAFVPFVTAPSYSATKAALHSYSVAMRYQLKDTPVEVLEIAPPYVQTELGGERQKSDPRAMPLADYITETMGLLKSNPKNGEIVSARAMALRNAERDGKYDELLTMLAGMVE